MNRKRTYKRGDTEQDYSRSNLLESSQKKNLHTEVRHKRTKSKRKKTKTSKRSTIQTPMSRGTKNIHCDTDLEEALSHNLEENKQPVDKLKDYDSNPYIFTTESEHTNKSVHEFEKISFKRLKIENRRLKAALHNTKVQIKPNVDRINDYEDKLSKINESYLRLEYEKNSLEDDLHLLDNFKKNLTDKQMKKLKNQDVKRLRDEITHLKHLNYDIEQK